MTNTSFDIVVIGGGPGGYVAAIRAAQLGLDVALVERQHLGGICLNWGCIPTKALLRSAEIYHNIQNADEFGIKTNGLSFDLNKIVERSRAVSSQLNQGIGHLLKKHKVTVIEGTARLAGNGQIEVGKDAKKTTLSATNIIISTGARARSLPGMEADGKLIWSYKEAMVPDTMPKSLLVVGSGAIGIEFASFFNTLGAKVTVVEVLDRVLPVEDEEISAMAAKAFSAQGMIIHTSAMVKSLKKAPGGNGSVTASVIKGKETLQIKADRVIVAAGIVGNTENLGLEGTRVKVEKTHIVTDEYCQTHEAGIYAIGDVAGPPWLAHKASHEGIICVEKMAGNKNVQPLDVSNIPGCTYCRPQIASVGLSENKAKEQGHNIKIGRFPFAANGKAIALGEPEGMIKTVFDADSGELLGAHMIGSEVTELIQGYVIGKTLETTEAELMHSVFPHPTLSEMMHESVLDAFGKAIHK